MIQTQFYMRSRSIWISLRA